MKEEEPDETPEPDIQPVGQDYIEEIKSEDGKVHNICTSLENMPNCFQNVPISVGRGFV